MDDTQRYGQTYGGSGSAPLKDDVPLFLGLDGGGTGCRAVIADGARVLGRGVGGAANPRAVGAGAAWTEIHRAVDGAFAAAGLEAAVKGGVRACFGLAGVGRPRDAQTFLARPHPFASLRLETDVHVALVGALGGEVGALLAVGTGSMVYGVDELGVRHRVGGWGFPVGDEGGGAWLGLEAARAALHATDGRGPVTALTEAVLARSGGPEGLLEALRGARPGTFAELAPLVLSAEKEDAVAARLRRAAVGHLVGLLHAFGRRYRAGPLRFSAVGSLAKPLLPDVLAGTPERFRAGYREPLEAPELGALRLARSDG